MLVVIKLLPASIYALCRFITFSGAERLKLSGGSHVTMFGKLTEEEWIDNATGEEKRRLVFVADEIFYASGGKKSESDTEPAAGKKKPAKEEEGEFTGFEQPGNFGSFYDE